VSRQSKAVRTEEMEELENSGPTLIERIARRFGSGGIGFTEVAAVTGVVVGGAGVAEVAYADEAAAQEEGDTRCASGRFLQVYEDGVWRGIGSCGTTTTTTQAPPPTTAAPTTTSPPPPPTTTAPTTTRAPETTTTTTTPPTTPTEAPVTTTTVVPDEQEKEFRAQEFSFSADNGNEVNVALVGGSVAAALLGGAVLLARKN